MTSDRFVDLLRHGSLEGGARFRGTSDALLSPVGLAQMRSVVAGLSGWDTLFSSPALRCQTLAQELATQRGLPMELLDELGERHFGDWEDRSVEEIPLGALKRFWRDPVEFTPPGAEPFEVFRDRVARGWRRIIESQSHFSLLVTHGGVIRIILGIVMDIPPHAMLRIEVPPACHTRLRVPVGEGEASLMFHAGPSRCGVHF